MKYIFLDRDGVINKDPGGWTAHSYVTKWEEFRFLPGVLEALRILKQRRIKVIIISNQAGVGKGYFTRADLVDVDHRMRQEVKNNGGEIDDSFYCMHKKEDGCDCRKPSPGLLKRAAATHRIDVQKTLFVGDSEVDVLAGRTVGARTVLILSGKATEKDALSWDTKPDLVFKDLLHTVKWIAEKEDRKRQRSLRREKEPR